MKDEINGFALQIGPHPEGIDELLRFSEYVLTNILVTERGEHMLDTYYVFSPLYREALDVFAPRFETPQDKAVWTDCFSALAQRMEANGVAILLTVHQSRMSALTNERPSQSPDAVRFVLVIAQTNEGDVACVRYDFQTAEDGRVSMALPGHRYAPGQMSMEFMSGIFTRTQHSARAKAYAEKMIAAYPPMVVDALIH